MDTTEDHIHPRAMMDMPGTKPSMTTHLEDAHGVSASDVADMSMADMTAEHDAMHKKGADHQHPGMESRATFESDIQVRDLAKRELDVRILPWNTVIETGNGTEEFARGAFDGTDESKVLLMGLEHEAHFGLGQDGGPVLTRHPVGKGVPGSYADQPDGAHLTVRVAATQRGDEVLTLAAEKIVTGVSAEFRILPGGTVISQRDGRRHSTHTRAALLGLSTTYRPAYGEQAAVLAVRSQTQEGEGQMADNEPAVIVAAPDETQNRVDTALARIDTSLASFSDTFIERLSKLEEQSRASFTLPGTSTPKPKVGAGEWMDVALRILSGERIPDSQFRTVQDLISSDNAGLVPNAYSDELIGVIDPSRPFMASTRRLATPTSGMSLVVPVINQRPTVAEQTQEKQELSSQITKIGTKTFEMVTKGGVGDISLQLLKRADRSFLDLYLQLLAEAYAIEADTEAVRALLDAVGGVGAGTSLDPEDLKLGDAYATSFDAIRRPPDTIWLSTEAIAAFIDAKASTTNQPLYPGLTASATAGGGIRGNISGLNAVHVPSLDAHGAFGIVGPANGFAWAEDGTYTLQVDVPAKAGRDVALVGMLWFAPWYPAAFTVYNVAS